MSRAATLALFDTWLSQRLKTEARDWLSSACARITAATPAARERELFLSFASAGRRCGKRDLVLGASERAAAAALVAGWDPQNWSVDQTARVRLILSVDDADAPSWLATLDKLFAASGLEEGVALYQGLAVLPHGELLRPRASEGVRANMKPLFAAVALDNPYPATWLDEGAWNQLVVKCLFVDCPLLRVVGLVRRANATLTRMLCDYANERWAAKRTINPLLWLPVGACLDQEGAGLRALERVLTQGTESERKAAALALGGSQLPSARALLARHPPLDSAYARGQLSWAAVV